MQSLGLAYAVYPAIVELYPERESQNRALQRHLTFFNTHPYVAAAIIGGVLHHEVRIAKGLEPAERVTSFKAALMGPLAALGDGFFWLSLRPAVGAVCAALVPVLGWRAPLLFLVLYNAVHLSLRAWLYRLGLREGDRLVAELAQKNLPARGARLRIITALSAGGAAAWLAIRFGAQEGGEWAGDLAAGCLLLGAISHLVVSRASLRLGALYLAAALAVAAGAFL